MGMLEKELVGFLSLKTMTQEKTIRSNDIAGMLAQADFAYKRADYLLAEQFYKEILANLDNQGAPVLGEVACCLQNLAEIYTASKRFDLAIPTYERLLVLGEQICGKEDRQVLETAFRLASAYEAAEMRFEASELYKQITNSAEHSLGIADPFAEQARQAYLVCQARQTPITFVNKEILPRSYSPEMTSQTGLPKLTEIEQDITLDPSSRRGIKKSGVHKIPRKIKHLRYGAAAAEEDNTSAGAPKAWRYWHTAAITAPFLAAFLLVTFISIARMHVDELILSGNQIATRLIEFNKLQSIDGLNGIKFIDQVNATMENDPKQAPIPYLVLNGGLNDLKAIWTSAFTRHDRWYRFDRDQLIGENGEVLYAKTAPEQFTAAKMQALKEFAQRYYLKTNTYPNNVKKWSEEKNLDYINPFTGRLDTPSLRNLNGSLGYEFLFPDMKEATPAFQYLSHGGTWRDEQKPSPGKINALALFKSQHCADGFRVTEFYIRGYDRNTVPLTAGAPGTTYVVGLRLGKDLGQESRETNHTVFHAPDRICIVGGSSANLWLMHQEAIFLMLAVLVLSLIGWIFLEFRKRIANPKKFPQLCELIFVITLFFLTISSIIRALP